AVDRRGTDADFQALTMQPGKFILAGLGLQVTVEQQVGAVPAKVAHQMNGLSALGMPVMTTRLPMTSMSKRFSAINAKIGEMSSPPRLGSRRRIGASNGSHSWLTSCAAGL